MFSNIAHRIAKQTVIKRGKSILQVPNTGTSQYLVNTGTFLVYQYCLKMWYLRSLERAGCIQKQTIGLLERQNGLVLSNARVPVSGTWSILFPKEVVKFLVFFSIFCYAMRYVSKHSGWNFIFFVFLYFAMLCYVSKHIGQNFIFFVFSLFRYAMRYVSKHRSQNFIVFVFLYSAMLYAMFQNIAVKIWFSLYFFIFLCYAILPNVAAKISYLLFFFILLCSVLCFKT